MPSNCLLPWQWQMRSNDAYCMTVCLMLEEFLRVASVFVNASSSQELTVFTGLCVSYTTRYNIITVANLTFFQLFLDCSALCSDWSAVLCDICNRCNFRVFNFWAHVSTSHGCCRNNSLLHNAVSSNITVNSNFSFLSHQAF